MIGGAWGVWACAREKVREDLGVHGCNSCVNYDWEKRVIAEALLKAVRH